MGRVFFGEVIRFKDNKAFRENSFIVSIESKVIFFKFKIGFLGGLRRNEKDFVSLI